VANGLPPANGIISDAFQQEFDLLIDNFRGKRIKGTVFAHAHLYKELEEKKERKETIMHLSYRLMRPLSSRDRVEGFSYPNVFEINRISYSR